MTGRVAVIAGATGLVGNELLTVLLEQNAYKRIFLLTRHTVEAPDSCVKVVVGDFDKLATYAKDFVPAHDYYCCLGTTTTEVSREDFIKVDHDYVVSFGKIAASDEQCEHFLLLTSIGANPNSHLLYNRTKGRAEEDIKQLNIPSIHIFRPSLILGKRKRRRWNEEIFRAMSCFISFFMVGTRRRFMAIDSKEIAKAMYAVTKTPQPGAHLHSVNNMHEIADRLDDEGSA